MKWQDYLMLSLPASVVLLFVFGIINSVFEFYNCKSRVFVDPGHHEMTYCVTDPAELTRLKPYLHQ